MTDVVIVQTGRSPIGKRGGSLAHVHPVDVLGPVLMEVLQRAGVEHTAVGQVVGGCINKVGAQAMNVTRNAWLAYGGATSVPATTVDSQCGSSQYALNLGYSLIASGAEEVVLACGVENMSRIPIGGDQFAGKAFGYGEPLPQSYGERFDFIGQFEGAERIATKYAITRDDADNFGLASQERAAKAIAEDRFADQIIPIEVDAFDADGNPTGERITVTRDEIPRDTSLEALAKLKPVARPDGIHTAGTSSQIADGASAVLMMSERAARSRGLQPLARVTQTTLVGCDPVLMLEGPIPATEVLLQRSGLSIDDIDVFEVNEAFAAVVLAWAKTVGADLDKVNPNGGAIALGHPLGATGTFLIGKAVHELQRSGGQHALTSICCGVGLGTGTLIERV
ncbi:thiolase family protein [Mycolicibacterium thermoresistibile]